VSNKKDQERVLGFHNDRIRDDVYVSEFISYLPNYSKRLRSLLSAYLAHHVVIETLKKLGKTRDKFMKYEL
jgi:hypothetical protein